MSDELREKLEALRSEVFDVLRRHEVSEQCFAEVAMVTQAALTRAKHLVVADGGEGDCPSCGGLNTSCPDGCGRDPVTGELNGTRIPLPTSDAPTLADEPIHADQITAPGRYMAPVDALGEAVEADLAACERAIDRMGWPEIHAFMNEPGQSPSEDAGGYLLRKIKTLFGIKPDRLETYQEAARRMVAQARMEARNG